MNPLNFLRNLAGVFRSAATLTFQTSKRLSTPTTVEEWVAVRRAYRRSLGEVLRDLERRSQGAAELLGLEGALVSHLIDRRPVLLPVERWGGDLGWRSDKRKSKWERMLGRPACAAGLLMRCEVAGEQWVPHPDAPANWSMTDYDAFARNVVAHKRSYELAQEWRKENRSVLNQRLVERFRDLDVAFSAQYHCYGGADYIDIALLLPDRVENSLLRIKTVWKGESTLAALVRTHFPDAVREHSEPWLAGQRLDVYVPSRRLAFEYQGEQHYRAVEFFGGKDAFRRNRDRDRRKAAACDSHGVALVVWKYSEPVNEERLRYVLLRAGVDLPESLRR